MSGSRLLMAPGLVLLGAACASAPAADEEPVKVTPCALEADRAAYDGKLIETTAFVSHGFEDFTVFDPECMPWPGAWIEYGGDVNSNTMYCCGVAPSAPRTGPLKIGEITVPVVRDDAFRRFDALIQRGGVTLHATLVGRFFAGQREEGSGRAGWRGYGHMGCCSLFALQQVRSVDPLDRQDVDYDLAFDEPDIREVGCGFREFTGIRPIGQWIAAQREAEERQPWAFADPVRVAREALARYAGSEAPRTGPAEKRHAQGRIVYEWPRTKDGTTYLVVVSRPSIVSFYARDSSRLAWIVTAAFASSCPGHH